MVSIVDAFVATFGLDDRDFQAGSKRVEETDKKTREGMEETAKSAEKSTKSQAYSFRTLRNEALALFSVFTGARSLKDFAANILESDANTGRLAHNLGVATKALSSWQMAVTTVGGSSGDADSSFQSLNDTLQNLVLRGDGSKSGLLGALGMTYGDLNDIPTAMLKISAASEHMSRQKFVSIAAALGLSPAMINLLEKGRKGVEDVVRAQERNGAITERDAIEAQRFQAAWANLTNFIKGQARPIITELTKDLLDVANGTGAMGEQARIATGVWGAMADAIGGAVGKMREWMGLNKAQDDPDAQITKRYLMAGQIKNAWLWSMHLFRKRHGMDDDPSRLPPPPPGGWSPVPASQGGGGGAGGGNVAIEPHLMAAGFTREQARGIAAGIIAESGGHAQAVNPTTGAYGLGQWLGPRKKELMRRYGPAPSPAQQLDFLIWELKGGDKGGASVGREATADGALLAYVNKFMRPGGGAAGDIRRGRAHLGGHIAPSRGGAGNVTIGPVTVYTSSNDPKAVGQEVSKAIKERAIVINANTGLQ